ncbi:MAG: hypothetical protein WBB85_12565, partial [Albidovulum sp.]|uniref:hypothetical protein n=1 Tax=Albidovulum sp. TaxID=1872424 RepID=UPI003C961D06
TALRQIDVAGKLLIFDCCRDENATFSSTETLGDRLIGPIPGAQIQQEPQVMCSTLLGKKAFGKRDGPTLFTSALLEALNGLAASPNSNWQIGSGTLSNVTGKILELNERGGASVQLPQFQLSRDFSVAVAPPTNMVTLFMTVEPPWSDDPWKIVLEDGSGNGTNWGPAGPGARHARIDLPALDEHSIRLCDVEGNELARSDVTLTPPVAFQPIPNPLVLSIQRTKSGRGEGDGPGKMFLRGFSADDGVARVQPMAPGGIGPMLESASGGSLMANLPTGSISEAVPLNNLDPGLHRVEVVRPDGARIEANVNIRGGDELEVTVPRPVSPHEWMLDAVRSGVIPPGTDRTESRIDQTAPVVRLVTASVAAGRMPDRDAGVADIRLAVGPSDGRFFLFDVEDDADVRLGGIFSGETGGPVWVRAKGNGWHELAFVPTLGMRGRWDDQWNPSVLLDSAWGPRSHLRSFVEVSRWRPLLAFLGRRDFASSATALHALGSAVEEAVSEKTSNSLAACAGALTAIACGRIEDFDLKPRWLENLANWFPTLPDGAVALGRYLQMAGKGSQARTAYLDAQKRGVPVFSLAVDWLAEGLQSLGLDHAAEAQRWSWQSDPLGTFTVLKLPEGDG